jgi:hypothetical protein
MRVLETPPLSDSGRVFAFDEHLTMAQRCKKAPASRPGLQECSIDLRDGSPLDGPNLFQSATHTMAFQKIVVGIQKKCKLTALTEARRMLTPEVATGIV